MKAGAALFLLSILAFEPAAGWTLLPAARVHQLHGKSDRGTVSMSQSGDDKSGAGVPKDLQAIGRFLRGERPKKKGKSWSIFAPPTEGKGDVDLEKALLAPLPGMDLIARGASAPFQQRTESSSATPAANAPDVAEAEAAPQEVTYDDLDAALADARAYYTLVAAQRPNAELLGKLSSVIPPMLTCIARAQSVAELTGAASPALAQCESMLTELVNERAALVETMKRRGELPPDYTLDE